MNKFSAIPTKYSSVQFRSRLEARWAAMFDLLGYSWEYEPIDLNGYIPDFILAFPKPMIVEVKPYIEPVSEWFWTSSYERSTHEARETLDKIERSGWEGEGLLVGSTMLEHRHAMGSVPDGAAINPGVLFGIFPHITDAPPQWATPDSEFNISCAEPFGFKACCGGPVDVVGHFSCRRCGDHDKGPMLKSSAEIKQLWREAGNRTQWRAPR